MHKSIMAAAFVLAFGSQFGQAEDAEPAASVSRHAVSVRYGDLDLNSEHDARVMLQRIGRAAGKACGGQPTFSPVTGRLDSSFGECRRRAIRRTIEQLAAPVVTRLYFDASRGASG